MARHYNISHVFYISLEPYIPLSTTPKLLILCDSEPSHYIASQSMLKHSAKWTTVQHSSATATLPFFVKECSFPQYLSPRRYSVSEALKLSSKGALSLSTICSARRRVRDDDVEEDEEEHGHNEEIALLELYSQSARGEALLVKATVDGELVEVLIFKVCSSVSTIFFLMLF